MPRSKSSPGKSDKARKEDQVEVMVEEASTVALLYSLLPIYPPNHNPEVINFLPKAMCFHYTMSLLIVLLLPEAPSPAPDLTYLFIHVPTPMNHASWYDCLTNSGRDIWTSPDLTLKKTQRFLLYLLGSPGSPFKKSGYPTRKTIWSNYVARERPKTTW